MNIRLSMELIDAYLGHCLFQRQNTAVTLTDGGVIKKRDFCRLSSATQVTIME